MNSITNELARIKLAGLEILRERPEEALAILPPAEGPCQLAVDLVRAEAELLRGDPTRSLHHLSKYAELDIVAPDWYALTQRALVALGRSPENLAELAARAPRASWLEERRATSAFAASAR